MNGPAFDGSGEKVEREVPLADVKAYEAAGYVKGGLPPAEKPVPKPVKAVSEEPAPAPKAEPKKGKK